MSFQTHKFNEHKFNEMVFQLLFSLDMGGGLEGDLIPFLMQELYATKKTVRAAYQRACAIFEEKEKLDQKISSISQEYAVERIRRVELNVLRFAFYAFSYDKDFSRKKVIAEALRIAKKFSTKEATAYINAILDTESYDESLPTLSSPKEHLTE